MKCQEIMTPTPAFCTTNATAQAAALIMKEEDVGIVPIIEGQSHRLVGVVTDRDLCLHVIAVARNPAGVSVEEVMTPDPITCRPDDDIEVCLERMKQHQVRRIPIVDDVGQCVGIIAQRDIALNVTDPQEVRDLLREISRPRRPEVALSERPISR